MGQRINFHDYIKFAYKLESSLYCFMSSIVQSDFLRLKLELVSFSKYT